MLNYVIFLSFYILKIGPKFSQIAAARPDRFCPVFFYAFPKGGVAITGGGPCQEFNGGFDLQYSQYAKSQTNCWNLVPQPCSMNLWGTFPIMNNYYQLLNMNIYNFIYDKFWGKFVCQNLFNPSVTKKADGNISGTKKGIIDPLVSKQADFRKILRKIPKISILKIHGAP